METLQAAKSEKEKFLIFQMGAELYGVPLLSVREVVEYKQPKPIPNSAKGFEGVINLRGEIIGILDLRKLLAIEPTPAKCLLIFESDRGTLGAVVDKVVSVQELSGNQVDRKAELPDKLLSQFVLGVGKLEEKLVTLIDLVKIPASFL